MSSLFTYGTLMVPEIMNRVCGGTRLKGEPATLHGFARAGVKGEKFPAIYHEPDNQLDGILYRSLHTKLLSRLDEYEGEIYQRIQASVTTAEGTESCWVYLLKPEFEVLLDKEQRWDLQRFVDHDLANYF